MPLLLSAGLDVVGPVADLGLLGLDGQAGLAAVRLVGLADATLVKRAAIFVLDLIGPFLWLGSIGQPVCFLAPRASAGGRGF